MTNICFQIHKTRSNLFDIMQYADAALLNEVHIGRMIFSKSPPPTAGGTIATESWGASVWRMFVHNRLTCA